MVPDAARAVLSRMRAAARAGSAPPAGGGSVAGAGADGSARRGPRAARRRRASSGFSGPGPDGRDPQPVGTAWDELVDSAGWGTALSGARLEALWPEIVGAANAEHASPEAFDPSTGGLLVRTSSTAWAEQLRLMLPALRGAIEARLGPGVVRDIQVVGPAPPRVRGRLRVRGRGPRDTYG